MNETLHESNPFSELQGSISVPPFEEPRINVDDETPRLGRRDNENVKIILGTAVNEKEKNKLLEERVNKISSLIFELKEKLEYEKALLNVEKAMYLGERTEIFEVNEFNRPWDQIPFGTFCPQSEDGVPKYTNPSFISLKELSSKVHLPEPLPRRNVPRPVGKAPDKQLQRFLPSPIPIPSPETGQIKPYSLEHISDKQNIMDKIYAYKQELFDVDMKCRMEQEFVDKNINRLGKVSEFVLKDRHPGRPFAPHRRHRRN